MKTVLEAWGQADLGPGREALDENVVWKSAASYDGHQFVFGGEYRGKAAVLAFLSRLSTRYFFQHYAAKELISKGEIVWGLFDALGTYLPPGGSALDRRPIEFEAACRWRVRDGKILEAQSFFDTAALLMQQGTLRQDAA
ncbi:MAG: nuclear transport factor 2 family protein [Alphaproteobacteria bacterium]|nr:nuclear transport factor 2 family protein [Alphaproteobacteria bacterium]